MIGITVINDFFLNRRSVCLNSDSCITYDLDQEFGCDLTGIDVTGIFYKVITGSKSRNFSLLVITSNIADSSCSSLFQIFANNTRKLIQFFALVAIPLQDISCLLYTSRCV